MGILAFLHFAIIDFIKVIYDYRLTDLSQIKLIEFVIVYKISSLKSIRIFMSRYSKSPNKNSTLKPHIVGDCKME